MILEQSLFGFGKNNSSPFSCSSKSPLCTKWWGLRCSRPGRGEAEVLGGAEAEPLAEVAPLSLIGLGGTRSHRGPVSIPAEQGEGQGNTRPQERGLTAAFPGRQSLPWTLQALPTPGKWLPSGRQSACVPLSTCDSRQRLPGHPPQWVLGGPQHSALLCPQTRRTTISRATAGSESGEILLPGLGVHNWPLLAELCEAPGRGLALAFQERKRSSCSPAQTPVPDLD